ncbi:MAG TPA: glycosyltransferase [Acidimicrobiales bacterium]|nr:glycosyltransferase [Acidimicrobiales bacterium]
MPRRLAFVPPRFGRRVIGGSEAASRQVALGFSQRGWNVDILTTCSLDHYTWGNDLPEGVTVEDGVTVHRFPNQMHASRTGLRAQRKIQDGVIPTLDEQISWLSWRLSVPGLFEHLLRSAEVYDAIVFDPYLFWTTTVCLPPVSDRAVVIPCLHDEVYARLDVVRPVLADPLGVWFQSEPEHRLAHSLGPLAPHHAVTGMGVTVPAAYDPVGFRRRHGLDRRPFILFAGRREPEKGWDWLVSCFAEAVRHHGVDMDLVTIGVGDTREPPDLTDRVINLGSVSNRERDDAMAAALAYLQPSKMESFSLTIMEAWLAGTPVLAIEGSPVVGWHCERSGGGETFSDGAALAAHLHKLSADTDARAEMAERGRRYVLDTYTWPKVLDRMEAALLEVI